MKKIFRKAVINSLVLTLMLYSLIPGFIMPDAAFGDEYIEDEERDSRVLASDLDFTSGRILVTGDVSEEEALIGSLGDVSILQYEDKVQAMEAYTRLSGMDEIALEVDGTFVISEEDNSIDQSNIMTEEENPFLEVTELSLDTGYDIAVIDTGTNNADRIVSVLGDDGNDENGHGQRMIDIIKDIAPEAKILSIKALGRNGVGDVSAVYSAIEFAIESNVKVINLSISAPAYEDTKIIDDAIEKAVSNGIIVVGSAGNNGGDAGAYIPGRIASAIIVGACDEGGNPIPQSNKGDTVDIFVPAEATSVAAAKVSGYILKNGSFDGVEDFFFPEVVDETEETEKTEETEEKPEKPSTYPAVDIFHGFPRGFTIQHLIDAGDTVTLDNTYAYYGDYAIGVWTITTSGGQRGFAYCVNPDQRYAPDGTYVMNFTGAYDNYIANQWGGYSEYNSSNVTLASEWNCRPGVNNVVKCMYYAYGGPGWSQLEQYVGSRYKETTNAKYALSHILLAYAVALQNGRSDGGAYAHNAPSGFPAEAVRLYDIITELDSPFVGFEAYTISIPDYQSVAIMIAQTPPEAYILIDKDSDNKVITNGNPYYELEGAEFGIYSAPNLNSLVQRGLFTNAKGMTPVSQKLTPGTYYIRELVAPKGYALNENFYPITVSNSHTKDDPGRITIREIPLTDPIGIILRKKDKVSKTGKSQGDGTLEGAEYTIKYYRNSSAAGTPDKTWIFKTDANGIIKLQSDYLAPSNLDALYFDALNKPCVPAGIITIQETKAPKGYILNTEIKTIHFEENAEGVVRARKSDAPESKWNTTNEVENLNLVSEEMVIKGGIKLGKIDHEVKTNIAQGMGTLEGAEFSIYNNSGKAVTVEGKEYESGKAVKTVTTDKEGLSNVASILPYGTYYVKETKAPEGYVLNSDWRLDFKIRENGEIIDATKEDKVPDIPIRGDIRFFKVDIDGGRFPYVPFAVHRLDKDENIVETHIIIADKEGRVDTTSSERAKATDNINKLDSYYDADTKKYTGPLDDNAAKGNIWFGETGAAAKGKGSLIYGRYMVEELKCEMNEGQTLLNQEVFDFEEIKTLFTNGKVFDLDNVFVNLPILLESDIIDVVSGTKTAGIGKETKVKDAVRYTHLKLDREYRLKTEIYYETRDGVKTLLGENDVPVELKKVDSSNTTYGVQENIVTVDTTKCNGGKLHAVDYLEIKNLSGEWVLLKTHNSEMDDERQRLGLPYLHTIASDVYTKDHVGTAVKEAGISDIIEYENLPSNMTYMIKGILVNKDTLEEVATVSQVLRVSDRAKEVTTKADGSIVAPPTGRITMPPFKFDGEKLKNATLVVQEILFDFDTDEEYIRHDSLDDEDQTIRFMEVTTEASDADTGTRTAVVEKTKIIDKVTIKNVIEGMEYTVRGDLAYKEDCTDAKGRNHKKGEVIATHEGLKVTADVPTGEAMVVELEYQVDGSLLEGISGVVFEDVWHKDVMIAKHHDYDAETQTPNWPKVRTKAWDQATKEQFVIGGSLENTIVDTVKLTNLTIGDTYKVVGTLHRSDGSLFLINGEEVTMESEPFTAEAKEMEIEIRFASKEGEFLTETIVVFEKLIHIGEKETEVARHDDPTDEDQTVKYVPEIGTTARDKADSDKTVYNADENIIVDEIFFKGLKLGTYQAVLTVMDKESGEAIMINHEPLRGTKTINNAEMNGKYHIELSAPSEITKGHSLVMYEELFDLEGNLIAEHKDLNSKEQTIYAPDIKTTLTSKGKKEVESSKNTKLVDTVKYNNLEKGRRYTLSGQLISKDNKEIIATTEKSFVALNSSGEVDLKFNVNTEELAGKAVVAFEEISYKEDGKVYKVAEHKDLSDEDQTVVIKPKGVAPQTGDENYLTRYISILLIALLTGLYAASKSRQ